jgi:hypothetical protein
MNATHVRVRIGEEGKKNLPMKKHKHLRAEDESVTYNTCSAVKMAAPEKGRK